MKKEYLDYEQELVDDLVIFDKNELPVNPTIKVIRKYSDATTLPDLDDDEMLTWNEMARQLYKKEHKAIEGLDKVRTEVWLIIRNFKKVETEERIEYSGDIKYKIYTVEKQPQKSLYGNFEEINGPVVDTSAFNTTDFLRDKPEFDKVAYKLEKLREQLMNAVITYSVHVESNNPTQEAIEIAKQKVLVRYSLLKQAQGVI